MLLNKQRQSNRSNHGKTTSDLGFEQRKTKEKLLTTGKPTMVFQAREQWKLMNPQLTLKVKPYNTGLITYIRSTKINLEVGKQHSADRFLNLLLMNLQWHGGKYESHDK